MAGWTIDAHSMTGLAGAGRPVPPPAARRASAPALDAGDSADTGPAAVQNAAASVSTRNNVERNMTLLHRLAGSQPRYDGTDARAPARSPHLVHRKREAEDDTPQSRCSGMVKEKVLPVPGSLATRISPP